MDSRLFIAETARQIPRPAIFVSRFRKVAVFILQKMRQLNLLQVNFGRLVPPHLPQGIAPFFTIGIATPVHVPEFRRLAHVPGILHQRYPGIRPERKFLVHERGAVAFGIAHIRAGKRPHKSAFPFFGEIPLEPLPGRLRLALHMDKRKLGRMPLHVTSEPPLHARRIPAFRVSLPVAPRDIAEPTRPQAEAQREFVVAETAVCKQRTIQVPFVL